MAVRSHLKYVSFITLSYTIENFVRKNHSASRYSEAHLPFCWRKRLPSLRCRRDKDTR